jgi:hypothetical protein
MRRIVAAMAIIATLLVYSRAAGEPLPIPDRPAQLETWGTLDTLGGSTLALPPGTWIVPEESWSTLDDELRRLQEAETRLTAQNQSLRSSAADFDRKWLWVGGSALVAGFLTGAAGRDAINTVRGWF